jgi:DNA-binding transcriptional LysR family regulator
MGDWVLLAQIEAFVEVASRRNVTRAAEALAVSQPALSARLRNLERELGTTLFVRAGHGVRLTEAARAFLPYAQRALESVREGRALMAELGRGEAGRLLLGAAPAVSTYVLPLALTRFRTEHPNVHLSVQTAHSEEILEMLLREQIEVGIVRALRHRAVESIPLYEDELALVVHPQHPFAARGAIRLEEVGHEQLVMFDRTSSYHELTNSFFREAGVVPRGVMELDNIDAAKKMVEHGLGVALLPRTAVAAEIEGGSLRAVHIADAKPLRRRIVAIRLRDSGLPSAAVVAFLEIVRDMGETGQIPAYGRNDREFSTKSAAPTVASVIPAKSDGTANAAPTAAAPAVSERSRDLDGVVRADNDRG